MAPPPLPPPDVPQEHVPVAAPPTPPQLDDAASIDIEDDASEYEYWNGHPEVDDDSHHGSASTNALETDPDATETEEEEGAGFGGLPGQEQNFGDTELAGGAVTTFHDEPCKRVRFALLEEFKTRKSTFRPTQH